MGALEGQNAVVTGGGSGIGEGVAKALVAEGARVVVCGRRGPSVERVASEISDAGGQALAVVADVSQEADVEQLFATARQAHGPTDILVNNAGIWGAAEIHAHDVEIWDRVMAVNLRGPFLCCREVLSEMRDRGRGHIVNISSESAHEHYKGNGAYGVSKHGLNALGEYVQQENQELGIRVDTVSPGMVVTEMTESSPGLDHDKCLYPSDIADLVLWLVTRRPNVKIGTPVLIQTMDNPWA